MPVRSKAQWRFMQAIAHGWKPKRSKGPSQKVAREFLSHGKPRHLPERRSVISRHR